MSDCTCYHCGLAIPDGTDFSVKVNGAAQKMCCAGCQAVAEAIVSNGLSDYYIHRDALPESPREALPQLLGDLGLFDHPEVQKGFVRPLEGDIREATLIIEGVTCAACVWLVEAHMSRLPGVSAVSVNYTTRRAMIRWDDGAIRLSQILEAIAAIGYRAHPYDAQRSEQLAQQERKSALWRLFVAGFGMMQVMMYAVPVYLADEGTMTPDIELLMRWASLVLTLPVVLYSSAPFFRNAWRDVTSLRVGMDVPVALGIGAAFLASLWATVSGTGEVYFDSVTMFVFFLLSGRYLEMMARQKAVRGVEALARATPSLASRLLSYPSLDIERIAAADLSVGNLVLIRPGETVPADGTVEDGESVLDESLLTGESRPVSKAPGADVVAGTVNGGGVLVVRVTRVGDQTRLAAIQKLMEQAAHDKPRLVRLADRIASRFVAVLILLAIVTAMIWYFIDPHRMLDVFVAVLVVSCPCALSLATPAVMTVATGVMASRGLLVARGHAIEVLARADHFVFDKTGTLTCGVMSVLEVCPIEGYSLADVLRYAKALEQGSEHPIAAAIQRSAETQIPPEITQIRVETGGGVEGLVDGILCRIGSPGFVGQLHRQEIPAAIVTWEREGDTAVAVGCASGWIGFIRVADQLRAEAPRLMTTLHDLGLSVAIMSGDTQPAVLHLAARLGVDAAEGGLTPEAKHQRLKSLQDRGAVVAMVGDGVNDAPVIAQAQVSVAMGSGADIARTRADIVLLGQLDRLVDGIRLARRTVGVVRQNLAWAFAYNILAIPLAMAGWVTPWMAGIGMSASSLFVVLNALRLQSESGKILSERG